LERGVVGKGKGGGWERGDRGWLEGKRVYRWYSRSDFRDNELLFFFSKEERFVTIVFLNILWVESVVFPIDATVTLFRYVSAFSRPSSSLSLFSFPSSPHRIFRLSLNLEGFPLIAVGLSGRRGFDEGGWRGRAWEREEGRGKREEGRGED